MQNTAVCDGRLVKVKKGGKEKKEKNWHKKRGQTPKKTYFSVSHNICPWILENIHELNV